MRVPGIKLDLKNTSLPIKLVQKNTCAENLGWRISKKDVLVYGIFPYFFDSCFETIAVKKPPALVHTA